MTASPAPSSSRRDFALFPSRPGQGANSLDALERNQIDLLYRRGTAETIHYGIVQRALLWLPLIALLGALAMQSLQETDPGELDAQLLTQELPPQAFIDQDFRSWLGKSHN